MDTSFLNRTSRDKSHDRPLFQLQTAPKCTQQKTLKLQNRSLISSILFCKIESCHFVCKWILSEWCSELYFNSHAFGMAFALPLGFEIVFVRNPISGSAAWFFIITLKFILTPNFGIEIHEKKSRFWKTHLINEFL